MLLVRTGTVRQHSAFSPRRARAVLFDSNQVNYMATKIPQDFTERYKAIGERCMLFGIPIAELSDDERLAMIGCMSVEMDRLRGSMQQYFEFNKILDKTARRFR